MRAKKSFLEIFSTAVSTFKNSFWGIFLTYCFAAPFLAIASYISFILKSNKYANLSPSMMIIFALLLPPLFYGGILFQTWQLLIIRNNMFTGENNLLEAFKKALIKALQVCLISIIFLFAFVFIIFVAAKIFPPCLKIIPLLSIPLLPFVVMFTGIVLEDGKFINVLINSFNACLSNYFRTLGYTILLMILPILATILISVLMIIPLFWFIGIILMIFLQLMITPFFNCFFAEFYFDLVMIDDEKPIENLTTEFKSYPEIIDVNQMQEQINQEELPKTENIQQPMQQNKEEPPKV